MKKFLTGLLIAVFAVSCTEMMQPDQTFDVKVPPIGDEQPMVIYQSQGRTVYQQEVLESTAVLEDSVITIDYTMVINREGLAPAAINRDYWVEVERMEEGGLYEAQDISYTDEQ